MNFSKEQLRVINSSEKNILLISTAASGKTACVTERVKVLLSRGAQPKNIVLLTFTNLAAEEMRKRIGNYPEMYIGTLHGYATKILAQNKYDVKKFIDEENFEGMLEFCLDNPKIFEKIKYLLIDEAQDLTELEFLFIFDILKPESLFIVGDHRQSIYDFRDSRPEIFVSLKLRQDFTVYYLKNNYRNGNKILSFAKKIIQQVGKEYHDNSVAYNIEKNNVIMIKYNLNTIYNIIKDEKKLNDWFILCRSHEILDEVYDYLNKKNIVCEKFCLKDLTLGEINMLLHNNTLKIMTIHAAKGLEAKKVIVIGQNINSDEERRISYVAATRAKNLLIWTH